MSSNVLTERKKERINLVQLNQSGSIKSIWFIIKVDQSGSSGVNS